MKNSTLILLLFFSSIIGKNIYAQCSLTAEFYFAPDTAQVGYDLTFYPEMDTVCDTLIYSWGFPGGSPSSSVLRSPIVSYSSSGIKNVTLIIDSAGVRDTATHTVYILAGGGGPVIGFVGGATEEVCNNSVHFVTLQITPNGTQPYTIVLENNWNNTQATYTEIVAGGQITLPIMVEAETDCGFGEVSYTIVNFHDDNFNGAINGAANTWWFGVVDCCPTIVNNGDFDQVLCDVTDFDTDLTTVFPNCCNVFSIQNRYCIDQTDNSSNLWPAWPALEQLSNAMKIDGSNLTQVQNACGINLCPWMLWEDEVVIIDNRDYHINFIVSNVQPISNPLNLQIRVTDLSGTLLFSSPTYVVTGNPFGTFNTQWRQYGEQWNSGINTGTVRLGIYQMPNPGVPGNGFPGSGMDYAIDNIVMQPEGGEREICGVLESCAPIESLCPILLGDGWTSGTFYPTSDDYLAANASTTISTSAWIEINGIFTINTPSSGPLINPSFEFLACPNVLLYPGASIEIDPSAQPVDLVIWYSHLRAICDEMWQEIFVSDPDCGVYVWNSTIEDAEQAIYSEHCGNFYIENSTFNKNWISIRANVCGATQQIPSYVYATTFECDDFLLPPHATDFSLAAMDNFEFGPFTFGRTLFASDQNIVRGSHNGIIAYDVDLTVHNTLFDGKQAPVSGITMDFGVFNEGVGVGAPSGELWVGDYQSINPFAKCNFFDCEVGVFSQFSSLHVFENVFSTSSIYGSTFTRGVVAENSKNQTIEINKNTIQLFDIGVRSMMNTLSNVDINDNIITVKEPTTGGSGPVKYGIFADDAQPTLTSTTEIARNTISKGLYGIWVRNQKQTQVIDNYVYPLNSNNLLNLKVGILVEGTTSPRISTNFVQGDTKQNYSTTYTTNQGISIRNTNARAEECNVTDRLFSGLTFFGNCNYSKIRGNDVRRHHWGWGMDACNIGSPQGNAILDQGNLWTGNGFGVFGQYALRAINPGTTTFQLWVEPPFTNPPFKIPVTVGPFNPLIPNPPGTAIASNPNSRYECDYYPGFTGGGGGEGMSISEFQIATDEVDSIAETEEMKWMMRRSFFEKLDDDLTLLDSSFVIEYFFDSLAQENIGILSDVSDSLTLLSDSTMMGDSLASLRLEKIDAALDKNSEVNANLAPEINEKAVNQIYLNTVAKGILEYTQEEYDELFAIASQCPWVGGNSVYSARTMLGIETDTLVIEDEIICSSLNREKETNEKGIEEFSNFRIAPNPANDFAIVYFQIEQDGLLKILNSLGEIVYQQPVSTDYNFIGVSIGEFPQGIYFLQIEVNNGLTPTLKLVVNH